MMVTGCLMVQVRMACQIQMMTMTIFSMTQMFVQGVIGLAPEDDIDGDGCIDAVTYDLLPTDRTDLTFFENKSSPLPEICEFQGENTNCLLNKFRKSRRDI